MPTYEYKCEACGHRFEKFQSITAAPIRKCPACNKSKVKRLIGMGAGLLFKGSGFYITDYRPDSYNKAAKADAPAAPAASGDAKPSSDGAAAAAPTPAKSETKTKAEAKSESPGPAAPKKESKSDKKT
jgi:putative FmdB family regulatory protein